MFTTKNLLMLVLRNGMISIIVIFTTIFMISIITNEINHVSDNVFLNNNLRTELEKRTSIFEELKRDIQIIGTNDIKIKNAYVTSDNILEFVNTLDSLATKNNLTQVYHFETPKPSSLKATFPISMIQYSNTFETNVLSFSNYLKEFNKLPYFTKIEGFSITSQNSLGWLEASTISYRAVLYTNGEQ